MIHGPATDIQSPRLSSGQNSEAVAISEILRRNSSAEDLKDEIEDPNCSIAKEPPKKLPRSKAPAPISLKSKPTRSVYGKAARKAQQGANHRA